MNKNLIILAGIIALWLFVIRPKSAKKDTDSDDKVISGHPGETGGSQQAGSTDQVQQATASRADELARVSRNTINDPIPDYGMRMYTS